MQKTKNKSGFTKTLDTLDLIRRVAVNIFFILFLVLFVGMWSLFFIARNSSQTINIKPDSTLVLDFKGSISEQHTISSLDRMLMGSSDETSEYRMFDILKVISSAKNDPRISQILIRTDSLNSVGWAQAYEIVDAIENFKKSGKKVISFGENMNQKQYLIASAADRVYLDPMGSVIIEGLSGYRQYYREALQDKLGVDVHLFKVGDFKSAAEPYIMDYASEESKQADAYWMGNLWDRYLDSVSRLRGVSKKELEENILDLENIVKENSGNLSGVAMHQGLVDGFVTYDKLYSLMNSDSDSFPLALINVNDDSSKVGYSSYLRNINQSLGKKNDRVAVVIVQGEIVDGSASASRAGANNVSKLLKSVRENNSVKSVVLRVDSPGGSVMASEKIRREVQLLKEAGKVVVVSMASMGASGGYWISMDADLIMADRSTITGSIGIFGLAPNFSRALENIGIHTDGIATTPLAGSFSVTRPLTDDVRSIMNNVMENGYDQFIGKISDARNMSISQVHEVAKGRVWTGEQAYDRDLVDELGGLNNAIIRARELAHLTADSSDVFIVESTPSPFESFFFNSSIAKSMFGNSMLASAYQAIPGENRSDIDFLGEVIKDATKPGVTIKTYAHCLCEI